MLPENITRPDILQAIEEMDTSGIPVNRHSTKWSVLHNGHHYPPKYSISIANIRANGKEWPASKFSGGDEANSFLSRLGFKIVKSPSGKTNYPLTQYSWTLLSDSIALKRLDKSSFLHHGSGIPSAFKTFFDLEALGDDEKMPTTLYFRGKPYQAHFKLDPQLQRVRLFWKADFAMLLKQSLPEWFEIFATDLEYSSEPPSLRLGKMDERDSAFEVEIIQPVEIDLDIDSELEEEQELRTEGAIHQYYGKRYERDPINRRRAIEYHGTSCSVCGFDFEEFYGERGKGFIEIHHIKPLSSSDQETVINPETDLVPVCANCHRMIHRRKDHILSVEEISNLIRAKR